MVICVQMLQFLSHACPEAVGGHRQVDHPTATTFKLSWKAVHGETCIPLVSKGPLEDVEGFEEYFALAGSWADLDDQQAIDSYFDTMSIALRDPQGYRVLQEMPAPPVCWDSTEWHQMPLNIVGDSVFWVGHTSGDSYNLLNAALKTQCMGT